MKLFSRRKRHEHLCCRDVNEFLAVYVEDGLDDEVRTRFESHLGRCPQCAEYLAQYRTTMDMVHQTDEVPSPPDVLVDRTLEFLRRHYDENKAEEGPRE